MGLFDSVYFPCPNCGAKIEVQSKALDPCMNVFPPEAVPIEIANEIIGDQYDCYGCGRVYSIQGPEIPKTVALTIKRVAIFPSDEE